MHSYIISLFVAVRGIAKKHKEQDVLIKGGLEGEDAEVTQREQDGRNNMQPGSQNQGMANWTTSSSLASTLICEIALQAYAAILDTCRERERQLMLSS